MNNYNDGKSIKKDNRKFVISAYIVSIIILVISIIILSISNIKNNIKDESVLYNETAKADYNVFLKENKYYDSRYLEKDNQYISDLIDYIETKFDYNLEASKKGVNYEYTYKVVADVCVKDKSTKNAIYEFSDELLKAKTEKTNTKLNLKKSVNVDYNKYNDMVKNFLSVYDLDNTISTVTVKLFVTTSNSTEKDVPVTFVTIPLANKTISIDVESNSVNEKKKVVVSNKNKDIINLGIIVMIAATIFAIIKLVIFIKDTENTESIYKMKLRKIMSNYKSYIQKIDNNFEFDGYETIEVRSFEDLLQIRELVQSPILMLERKEEAHFMVSSNNKLLYKFDLNNGTKKPRFAPKKESKHELNV